MIVYGYIYMVRNKINNKIYFGITEDDFDTRYKENITKHTHNKHLKRSIKKYGIENFEINKEFDVAYSQDDLYDLEDMYMCLYNTLDPQYGYNKRRSGRKHKGAGKHSEESRRKMSENHADFTGENHPNYGKHLSEEHRCKISETLKTYTGENHHRYGKHHTEETKQKISESRKGQVGYWKDKHISEDAKRKQSETMKGKYVGKDNPNAKKVVCVETGQIFNTCKDAEEWVGKNGGVSACCNGRQKTCGGYHWQYVSKVG